MKHSISLALLGFAAALTSLPAEAAVSDWIEGNNARVRLLATGVGADGQLTAGIEIELAPGWKTYWRNPGDAGIAPVIDFTGSQNIGTPTIAFPVPHRVDDGTTATNVYEDHVVLTLAVPVSDPQSAVDLALKLDIGVCEQVCIPDHFEGDLKLDKGAADGGAADILAAAAKTLPGQPETGMFLVEKAWRDGGTDGKPVFDFTATVPDAKGAQVFVEGPADWYASAPDLVSADGGKSTYRFTFDRLGSDVPLAGANARFTIVSGGKAIEQVVPLD